MLEIKRELRRHEEQLVDEETQLSQMLTSHEALRHSIAQKQTELETVRNEDHGTQIQIVAADKDLKRIEDDREKAERRVQALGLEIEELESALQSADEEETSSGLEIDRAERLRVTSGTEFDALQENYADQRMAVEAQNAKVTEMRVRAAQAKERSDNLHATLDRLSRSMEELRLREGRIQQEITEGARQQGELSAHVLNAREEVSGATERAKTLHDALVTLRETYEEAKRIVAEHEMELKERRVAVDHGSKRLNELALREKELALTVEHLIDQIQERHRLDIRQAIYEYHARELPDETVSHRVDELLRVIERMGDINLMAIEEYEQQSQRYEFLTTQQKDLEQALLELENAIRQMNRESRRLFSEAFEAVNERFKKIFPAMFGGGKAELRLTDPNDLLESGVDIVAQPPGKKLGNLELMSGGEKALTAVSLIFALFQYKPSPFCLLDEVDAPLDEANIDRFASAVRQMTDRSQFILVTHAKRTMEAADMLYGVTMEEAGVSKLVSVSIKGGRDRASEFPSNQAAVA
jgi:chromosome segregation protein